MITTHAPKLLAPWLLGCAAAAAAILYLAPPILGAGRIDVAIQLACGIAIGALAACWLDRERYPAAVPPAIAAIAAIVLAPAAAVPAVLVFGLVVALGFTVPLALSASLDTVR